MSEPASARPLADIEAQAAAWVRRRHFWDWSADEQAGLDAWLAESISNRVAYWRMESGFARTEKLVALRDPATETPQAARRFPVLMGIAAAAALIAVIGIGATHDVLHPHDRIYSTPIGGHEKIVFADGTKVELNTDTVLRARMTTDERTVWLEKGEAFFQVKHDAAHPFMVMVGDRRVTDLGTAFLVRRDDSRMELAVVQGRVRFDAAEPRNRPSDAHARRCRDRIGQHGVGSEEIRCRAAERAWLAARRAGVRQHHACRSRPRNSTATTGRKSSSPIRPRRGSPSVGTFPIHDVAAFTDAAQDVFELHVENRGSRNRDFALRRASNRRREPRGGNMTSSVSEIAADLGGASAAVLAGGAYADEFNMPGGDLKSALNAYAMQARVALIVSSDVVAGMRTKGVHGDLTADAALSRILDGTGLDHAPSRIGRGRPSCAMHR